MMHSEDVDLEIASEKGPDGSAKCFTRPAYSLSHKSQNIADNEGNFVEK